MLRLKAFFLFVLASVAGAQSLTLQPQLRKAVLGADRVELTWRSDLHVEQAGITALKKIFRGEAVAALLSRLTFEVDLPKEEEAAPPLPPDAVTIPIGNCRCSGSHLLRFWAQDQLVADISFHHGTHLRHKELNDGRDATLTTEAQSWLQTEADWENDLAKIESFRATKKTSSAKINTMHLTATQAAFEAELQRRGVRFSRDQASGRYQIESASSPLLVSLANLEKAVASDGDLSRVARFVDTVLNATEPRPNTITSGGLLWLLEPNDYADEPEIRVAISDKVDRVLVHLSADRSKITWVNRTALQAAGIREPDASAAAFANLDRELASAAVEFKEIDGVRLGFLSATEPVKASLILAPDFRKKVEEAIGWPVLAVTPDRNFLYFWAARHDGFVGRVGSVVVKEHARAAYPISTEVYSVDDSGVRAIGEFPQSPRAP